MRKKAPPYLSRSVLAIVIAIGQDDELKKLAFPNVKIFEFYLDVYVVLLCYGWKIPMSLISVRRLT